METLNLNINERGACTSLGSACSHLPCIHLRSFLCLPHSIRHRIYHEAGRPNKGDVINLNRPPDPAPQPPLPPSPAQTMYVGGQSIQTRQISPKILHPSFISSFTVNYNLLFTCRAIYAEVSSILYSTHKFFIRYCDAQSLKALRNLTPYALSSLTHLTIHLNVASCGLRRCCIYYPGRPCRCKHDKPLATSSGQIEEILSKWQSTASSITAYIKPSHLQLHFICDVEDLEVGNCSDKPESLFRFLDLSLELRPQILEYTDIVTPLCEVEWNPEDGFYPPYSRSQCSDSEYEMCPLAFHYACQFRHCWYSSRTGCYCSRYHSAFSILSKCNC
jgi:hypothetical protein